MEFDLDLEDLDLKSVDIVSNTSMPPTKNISFNNTQNQSTFKPTIREQNPNLTISTNNHDAMPSMNSFNSDKEVDFGLNLLVNKKKQRPDAEVTKLSNGNSDSSNIGNSNNLNSSSNNSFTNIFNNNSNTMPQKLNFDDTEVLQNSLFDDNTNKG